MSKDTELTPEERSKQAREDAIALLRAEEDERVQLLREELQRVMDEINVVLENNNCVLKASMELEEGSIRARIILIPKG